MAINYPIPVIFFDEQYDTGEPLAGGKLYAFEAGTSNPKVCFQEPTGNVPTTHPIVLNAAGRASVWLSDGAYKWVLTDKDDNIIWTKDNVGLVGSNGGSLFVSSVAALRNLNIDLTDYASIAMAGSNVLTYAWDEFSAATDNGFSVIIPSSSPATGRWILKYDGCISSSVFSSLSNAVTKIGTANVTLTVSKTETLTADLTIPSNISLKILKGGSIAGAFTLSMLGLLLSDEREIISSSTIVRFGVNGVHKIQSRWFNSFAKAVESCTQSDNVLLEHDTAMSITNHLTIPSNVILRIVNVGATLNIANTMTLTIDGKLEADRITIFSGLGDVKLKSDSTDCIYPEWFGVSTASLDNTPALQKALDVADDSDGYRVGIVRVASGTFVCTGTLTLPTKIIFEGAGASQSIIKHNPSTFISLIEADGGSDGQIIINNLGFKGRGVNTGNTKYLFNLVNFKRNCSLSNIYLSNSVGYIKINEGSLCSLIGITCSDSTPNNTLAGVTNTQWAEIWDVGSAPINLIGMTGAVIKDLTINNVGSELNSGFGDPNSVIRMEASDSTVIDGLSIYNVFNNGTYNIYANYMALFTDCTGITMDGLLFVSDHAKVALLKFERECNATITSFRADSVESSYLIHSKSVHTISVDGLGVFASQLLSPYWIEQNGHSVYGIIDISNSFAITGLAYTDTSYSIYPNNITDTFAMGVDYREGISDKITSAYSTKRIVPKIGITVSAGSNPTYTGVGIATGHYIQINSGTYTNEAGKTLQIKKAQGSTAADVLCAFRLRPQTASKYYRVYISEIGSPYLVKSDTAFATDRGDWVAQFRTNASTEIVHYADGSTPGLDANPYNIRATAYVGSYSGGSDLVQVYDSAAPTIGIWSRGDIVINSQPASNQPYGWQCTVAGSPGTWVASTYVDLSAPVVFDSDVTAAKSILNDNVDGNYSAIEITNENNTAGSTNESITTNYFLRGGDNVTNRNAGYLSVAKDDSYNTTFDSTSKTTFGVALENVNYPMLSLSYYKGIEPKGRIQGAGSGAITAGTDIQCEEAYNLHYVTGTGGTNIERMSNANWTDGSIVTFVLGSAVNFLHNSTPSGDFKPFFIPYGVTLVGSVNSVIQFVLYNGYWRQIRYVP